MNWRPLLGRRTIASAVLSVALLIPALFPAQEAHCAASAPSLEDVRAEAVQGGYRLIDLGELRERLEREPGRLLLVDTREDWEYRTGHIPDAINFSFEPTTWAGLTNLWPLRETLGVDRTRPLVFY